MSSSRTAEETTQRRRLKRLLRWGVVAVTAAGGAYVALTTVRLAIVYDDALEARAALLAAEALLWDRGLTAETPALAEAERQAGSAREGFRSAEGFLRGEPLLVAARWLPVVGWQVSAAQGLAAIGYEGSEAALSAVHVLRRLQAITDGDGLTTGEKVVAFLEGVQPEVDMAQARLASIEERQRGLDKGWLLPPLASFAAEIRRHLPRLEKAACSYADAHLAATQILGLDKPRSFLVLGLDNTELTPGGGLIGVYGVVTLENGRVVKRSFEDVTHAIEGWQERSGGEYVTPPGPLRRYLLRDWTWNLALANWSPDFAVSAQQALFFYEGADGSPVDGVIALDFVTMRVLLEVLGPVEVPAYGLTVEASGVVEMVLGRPGGPDDPGGARAVGAALAAAVMDRLTAVGPAEWPTLLSALERLGEEKHLLLYGRSPQLQESLRGLGLTGEVRDTPGDFLLPVEASVHSTKLNLVVEREMWLRIKLDEEGNAHHELTLRYSNEVDQWAVGRPPQVVWAMMMDGFYGGYLRVLAPEQAVLREVTLDRSPAGAEEVFQEEGRASFGRYFALPRGARREVGFAYSVPEVVQRRDGRREYRLLVQKQAGTEATPLTIDVVLPQGARPHSVSLGGRELAGAPLHIEASLSRDLELAVVY